MPTGTRTATALKNKRKSDEAEKVKQSSKTKASTCATQLPPPTEKGLVTPNPFQKVWTTVDNRNFSSLEGATTRALIKCKTQMKRVKHLWRRTL